MLGTAHFGLVVADLDRSVVFYRDTLGFELIGTMERKGEDISAVVGFPNTVLNIAFLKLPDTSVTLELIQYLEPRGIPVDTMRCNSGNAHICFFTDDIRSEHSRLVAKGVEFISQPTEILTGMNQGAVAAYFRDPDGVSMELFQAPAIVERNGGARALDQGLKVKRNSL